LSIYFLLLSIMCLLLYVGITCGLVYAPKKIKIISVMALILMTARYIALIIFSIVKSQNYLYLLKPIIYTNYFCIPIYGILSLFMFSRNNKIKLKKILFMCSILCVAYCIVIYKSSASVSISDLYGYILILKLEDYCNIFLLVLNTIFFIKGIGLLNKEYSNKMGAICIVISSSLTLLSVLLTLIDTSFAWILLGDIAWIITIDYGLIKFKR